MMICYFPENAIPTVNRRIVLQVDQTTSAYKMLGNNENAVKTQTWCAVATYVLIVIIKKELQIDASLYTLPQILSVSVFEKNQLQQALQGVAYIPKQGDATNQLCQMETF